MGVTIHCQLIFMWGEGARMAPIHEIDTKERSGMRLWVCVCGQPRRRVWRHFSPCLRRLTFDLLTRFHVFFSHWVIVTFGIVASRRLLGAAGRPSNCWNKWGGVTETHTHNTFISVQHLVRRNDEWTHSFFFLWAAWSTCRLASG